MVPALDDARQEDDGAEDSYWLILYPEDFNRALVDEDNNLCIQINDDQAAEIERHATKIQNHDPDAVATDGGAPFCANCQRTIAREDLIRRRGRNYHSVCAPDDRSGWGAAHGAADRSPDRHPLTDGGEATDADVRAAVEETEGEQ